MPPPARTIERVIAELGWEFCQSNHSLAG